MEITITKPNGTTRTIDLSCKSSIGVPLDDPQAGIPDLWHIGQHLATDPFYSLESAEDGVPDAQYTAKMRRASEDILYTWHLCNDLWSELRRRVAEEVESTHPLAELLDTATHDGVVVGETHCGACGAPLEADATEEGRVS